MNESKYIPMPCPFCEWPWMSVGVYMTQTYDRETQKPFEDVAIQTTVKCGHCGAEKTEVWDVKLEDINEQFISNCVDGAVIDWNNRAIIATRAFDEYGHRRKRHDYWEYPECPGCKSKHGFHDKYCPKCGELLVKPEQS